jgi:hypothetical protein
MKKSILNSILCTCFVLSTLVFFSCKTRRNSIRKDNPSIKLSNKEIKDSILESQLTTEWLKARGSVTVLFPFNDDKQTIDINLRLKKDSLIWLNLSKFKKKIARGSIGKDSIKFTAEIPEKVVCFGPLEKLKDTLGSVFVNNSYQIMEEALTGGSFIDLIKGKLSARYEDEQVLLSWHSNKKFDKKNGASNTIYKAWFNSSSYKCNKLNLSSSISSNEIELEVIYSDWLEIGDNSIPQNINISFSISELTYSMEIKYKSIKFDIPQKFPAIKFNEKYKRILINEK